ncbi:hypothetical protein LSH36_127g06055, partial [Paralvinella palmiformis]
LKRRLVKLKQDLANKKKKLQKCERLSNARHHVQQKIREQFQLTKTEQTDGDGISSHIHTKVTFERCTNNEADLSSEQEDEKISKHECTYVSPTAELNATEEISFKTSTSAVLTGTSPNSEFEKPNILKYDSRSSQTSEFVNTINDQLISAVEKSTSESLLSDQLNRTYVVESNGHSKIRNCDMNHPFVADQTPTDTLHSSSDSILSQNVNRKKKQHICTVEHKSKYSHRSEEKGISTEGYDFLQSQHYPDLLKESVELKNSSGHQSNRVLESFDNKEKYKDSKVLWQDDQASRAPANENTEPLTERRRANEEKIDSVVNKSVMISDCLLDNESELSENVQ